MPTPVPSRFATGRDRLHWRSSCPRSRLLRRMLPDRGRGETHSRNVSRLSLKGLSDAKRKIEMTGALKPKLPSVVPVFRIGYDVGKAWEKRRIQIVSEVQAQWADRCLISHTESDGVRQIVAITF